MPTQSRRRPRRSLGVLWVTVGLLGGLPLAPAAAEVTPAPVPAYRWVPADRTPAPRADHAMAYDPNRGETLMFGGCCAGGPLGDTWVWDGFEWIERTPAVSPSPRHGHAMAWDGRGILLFGGCCDDLGRPFG